MSVAQSYARALFESGSSNGSFNVDHLNSQVKNLGDFADLLAESKELRVALLGPATSTREKVSIVEEIGKKLSVDEVVSRFLKLVARNGRLGFLRSIQTCLRELSLAKQNGVLGHVVSADALSEAELNDLAGSFEQKIGKKVEFEARVDPRLLAGLKVTVAGTTYDGSLRAQLDRLERTFLDQ